MSDDVRERSEAVDAVALLFAKRRQPAPTMDGAHQPNPAEIKAAQEAVEIVRAALAVAPATAQPVAWVVMGNRGTRRSPPYLSLEAAERCAVELDRGEFLEDIAETPHRVVPLAPPATGDAAAVALLADARKCVALANTNGYYDVWLARCDAILRAIPLPATANRDIERSST